MIISTPSAVAASSATGLMLLPATNPCTGPPIFWAALIALSEPWFSFPSRCSRIASVEASRRRAAGLKNTEDGVVACASLPRNCCGMTLRDVKSILNGMLCPSSIPNEAERKKTQAPKSWPASEGKPSIWSKHHRLASASKPAPLEIRPRSALGFTQRVRVESSMDS